MIESIDYPPYHCLIRIFENCPSAIFFYISLWKDDDGREIQIFKEYVDEKDFNDLTLFREALFSLQELNLLKFSESENDFTVMINRHTFNMAGRVLC